MAGCTAYWWRVRVWTGGEAHGPWSDSAPFETGILDASLWRARWVTGEAPGGQDYRALYLRGTADLAGEVVRARAYVSALGWYRFFVNGNDLTGPALVPRWTPFDAEVEYQVYDVTDHVRQGTNVLALAVGDGRFRGRLGVFSRRAVYGDRLAGLVQVHLELADGSRTVLASDETWQAGGGRILVADPMHGERVDIRIDGQEWMTAPVAPARFTPVEVLERDVVLVAEDVERVTEIRRLPAVSVRRSPSGKQIVDFGQNFAGVVRILLSGPAGTVVRLTHSEVLRPDGELELDYLLPQGTKPWYQRDEVTLNGADTWYQPWFTIHGFRYLEVDGLPSDLRATDVEAVVLSSALPEAGTFECSDERLNRLHTNVQWSLRSNFTDTPTDCPTRERSGWTGDIQVFAPTATGYADVQAYLRRYLHNLALEQHPDGTVPPFIPAESSAFSKGASRLVRLTRTSAGWGDSAVLLPWTLYQYYGDRWILERQYSSMTAWVDQLAQRAREHRSLFRRLRREHVGALERHVVDTGWHWGEWLRPGESFIRSAMDSLLHKQAVVATAYLEHSARRLADIAALIGREKDAEHYGRLADTVRTAWRAAFLHADGRIGAGRQDDYVRALAFDLLEPSERPDAVTRLVDLIRSADDHLGTGFLSTPLLLPVLADHGRADVAWRLLLQTTSPSWLYQLQRGGTTTWETWEGHTKDGKPAASHNHYAFGAVARFLTEYVAGLAPAEPGYRVISIRPHVGGDLTSARASVKTPYGAASSSWRRDGDTIVLDVTVPPGTTARVHVGSQTQRILTAGAHSFVCPLSEHGVL
ncbi:alpha-L-rhamnosidase [Streptomyces sp. CS131]|uniref:alpha-L-rhamnosidase n=1 Tax=Streptomyces sp. CS131 TaxID=2162711 RepID=UPI0013A5947D|nr:alpha-L-rhamnosidase [Streptomyces sp. CS131]